jgi:protocatechuate 3,4-dioxygenase alpha subunit
MKRLFCNDLAPRGREAKAITITGQVLDGDGRPVPDAVLEFWQADEFGTYAQPDNASSDEGAGAFLGWARVPTDAQGSFTLRTIKPGAIANGSGSRPQAPHINVTIFMRGLIRHLYTRMYFDGEPPIQSDAALLTVPENRRATLVARRSEASGKQYLWNVVLQGADETVFFDL